LSIPNAGFEFGKKIIGNNIPADKRQACFRCPPWRLSPKKGGLQRTCQLFTAMARSAGIPCRTVGGLIYLGDQFQAFGLHAWNEVVINGFWIPVDPTWGQTTIDATHIRFPMNISKEWQVMAAIPQMKLKVLHVEHQK
jgi:hypothetical protein